MYVEMIHFLLDLKYVSKEISIRNKFCRSSNIFEKVIHHILNDVKQKCRSSNLRFMNY